MEVQINWYLLYIPYFSILCVFHVQKVTYGNFWVLSKLEKSHNGELSDVDYYDVHSLSFGYVSADKYDTS